MLFLTDGHLHERRDTKNKTSFLHKILLKFSSLVLAGEGGGGFSSFFDLAVQQSGNGIYLAEELGKLFNNRLQPLKYEKRQKCEIAV